MNGKHLSERGASTLWIVLITAASAVTSLALACATPFAALAAIGALYLRRRDGVAMVVLAWIVSHTIGFGLLHYPHDPRTLTWAVGVGCAAVAAALAAYPIHSLLKDRPLPLRMAATYVAAFIGFKVVILLFSLGLGSGAAALSTSVITRQFLRDGAILLALVALYHVLIAIGLPAPVRRESDMQPA